MSLPQNAALIVIDVQKGFDDPIFGPRNNPQAEDNIARLLAAWRETKRPIFHVQHMSRKPNSPLNPASPGNAIKEQVQPQGDEPIIPKSVHSALIGTDLEARLRDKNYDTLIITGITTDHCVSTTTRMAANLGFKVYVVSDGTATFDRTAPGGKVYPAEDVHAVTLASLSGEFATIEETNAILSQLV